MQTEKNLTEQSFASTERRVKQVMTLMSADEDVEKMIAAMTQLVEDNRFMKNKIAEAYEQVRSLEKELERRKDFMKVLQVERDSSVEAVLILKQHTRELQKQLKELGAEPKQSELFPVETKQ